MKKELKLGFLLVILVSSPGCATNNFEQHLKNVPQAATAYLQPATADQDFFTDHEQTALKQQYLCHYFSPWTGKCLFMDAAAIKLQEVGNINKFTNNPGWAANMHPHTREWTSRLVENMEMPIFPNSHIKAITIRSSNLRVLPADEPLFEKRPDTADGYPFDLLQESYIPANTPVLILQTSKDKVWNLVLTLNTVGWLHNEDVDYVTNDFIRRWHTKDYIAILKDHAVVRDGQKESYFYSRLGVIYPFVGKANEYYRVLVAQAAAHHTAAVQTVWVAKQYATTLPLSATPRNIALVANSLLGEPYGWGGIYGYRDCSATLMDLFAPFAIWLPRNSKEQLQAGKFISFADLSNKEKQLLTRKYGVPFLSLIGLPGHIVLYLSDKDGRQYVYHTVWSAHHVFGWQKSVVGRTVITPLEGGLLDKAVGITTLGSCDLDYNKTKV